MKNLLLIAAMGLFAGNISAAESPNQNCPISGKPAAAANTTNYSKTVALCCNKCKASFEQTPKAYLSSILASHSGQCPLSKKAITTAVNVTYKRQVNFCSAECKAKFDAAPDKFIKDVR
jgi:YHS domain-containing protein